MTLLQTRPRAASGSPRDGASPFRSHRRALRRRSTIVLSSLAASVIVLALVSLMLGSYVLSPGDVLASVLRIGSDPSTDFIVQGLRMPRVETAVLVGLALGTAGVLFQRVLGNPLASPDLIGIASGASAATVAGIVIGGLGGYALSAAAIGGALAAAAVILALAWRGGVVGYRFILVGIGVGAFLESITGFLLSRATVADARAATSWIIGSIGLASETDLVALAVAVVVLLPTAVLLGRRLRILELGADTATALGVRVQPAQLGILAVAVVLVALATAAAGPIAFVALMAGPIAGRLLGSSGGRTVAAALVGTLIVLLADLIAQHLAPTPLSTGIVTGLVGAPYIAWLLIRSDRRRPSA
ncbi:MAG: iron chelate uptake ABC transporter family permease subunit [Leifsonia flava]